jgi:4-hydroxy-3-polyprenylbenzoate decarboxylase
LLNSLQKPVVVGISGASGIDVAKATIDRLLALRFAVWCTVSPAARQVWHQEVEQPFKETVGEWGEDPNFSYFASSNLRAPMASGSVSTRGMVIVPCSMGTIAAIAHGLSRNLLQRSADVCIKENRKLIIVPRETPLSAIHLENMLSLARLGVTILPMQPAFYLKPRTIDQIIEYFVDRIIVSLDSGLNLQPYHQYRYDNTEEEDP